MKKTVPFILVIALCLIGCSPSVSDIYITANGKESKNGELVFNAIEEGLNAVVQLRSEGVQNTLTLHLMEGEYRLSSPIRIQPEHGPLKIVGKGADKTIIKGSKVLTPKWEKYNDNIWVAQLQKEDKFDQLFVDLSGEFHADRIHTFSLLNERLRVKLQFSFIHGVLPRVPLRGMTVASGTRMQPAFTVVKPPAVR